MSAVQWVKKDGNLGQFYRAVQPAQPYPFYVPGGVVIQTPTRGYQATGPQVLSGAWSITAQVFNKNSGIPTTFPGGGVPKSFFPQQPILDALIPQKVDEFFKQYVQPNMGDNQWARVIAIKADAVNPNPPGPGQSVSQPWYVKCYTKSGMGTPCPALPALPLTPGEFDARFGASIRLFNTSQSGYYRPPTTVAGVQWLGRAAPGQLGMSADDWQWWNTSGDWWINVLDAVYPFPATYAGFSTDGLVGAYHFERFPGAQQTAQRWVALQRMRTLYEQWSKGPHSAIKVCAFFVKWGGTTKEAFRSYCYDPANNSLVQNVSTGTQIKTTCPAGYSKIVHDDGSFGCVAPYVSEVNDVTQRNYPLNPTPRGYRQPLTPVVAPTYAPGGYYHPPTFVRGVQWLGRVVNTLGATDAEIVQIKSLLSTWAQGEGSQSAAFQNYGTKPEDYVPPFTTVRDGATLESFSVWWNSGGKPPHLQTGQGNIASAPPDAEHLQALLNWAASHGINPNPVPPQQPPTPMDLSTCLSQCQNLYGLDPIQYATCAAACAQKFPLIPPPVPISPAPTQPPVSPPPAPTPTVPPPTTPSTSSESKSSPWPWVIGGAALLGLGALVMAGGRKQLQENPYEVQFDAGHGRRRWLTTADGRFKTRAEADAYQQRYKQRWPGTRTRVIRAR